VRRLAIAVAVGLAAGVWPAPAGATELTRSQLIALAQAARSDPAALGRLRSVTSVDGAPANIRDALAGAGPADLDTRLDELAAAAATPSEAPDVALGGELPEPPEVEDGPDPEPAEGGELDIGIPLWLAGMLALGAVVAGALVARQVASRRVIERQDAGPGEPDSAPSQGELEAAAEAAAARGEFGLAMRLRFQAGLVTLDSLGVVRLRPSLTAPAAARELGSGTLADLAGAYERVVFGGADAGRADDDHAREGWRSVISEAREE
jgi:hypothetical protein